jgi:hypothetical protein
MGSKNHTLKSTANALNVVEGSLKNIHGNKFLTEDELAIIHKNYNEIIPIALRISKLNRRSADDN